MGQAQLKYSSGRWRCLRCGKVAFLTEEHAVRAALRFAKDFRPLRPYYSKKCEWWHHTSKNGDIWYRDQMAQEIDTTAITMRDYQEAAITMTWDFLAEKPGHPLIALPTGTGKSLVIAEFLRRAHTQFPNTRSLVLTHVKELIVQDFNALLKVWKTAPAGIYSAGVGRKEADNPITFAGIQSVYQKPEIFDHVDLVFIDEAHLFNPRQDSMYQQFIEALTEVNEKLRVIGCTATPYRMGKGMLTDEDAGVFTDVSFDLTDRKGFNYLLEQGWLAPLVPRRPDMVIDVEGVKMSRGDFHRKQLQERVDQEAITHAALQEAVALAHDRKHWLVFASGIEHAMHISDMLNDIFDIPATYVHSKISDQERNDRIKAFKRGEVRVMVNNNILTTGFDFPEMDCIVMLRPTASPGLWVQMLGRGTRPADGKRNCLVLDFAGNTERLGPINDPVLPRKRGKGPKGIPPVRLCEHCGCYSHAAARFCENVDCGKEFPKNVRLRTAASMRALIAENEPLLNEFKVDKVIYRKHKKQGKPDSMRVTYVCGLRQFNEYICLDHGGYAAHLAQKWWDLRSPWGIPPDVESGLKAVDYLPVPKKITVMEKANSRYPEICGYEW